MLDESRLLKDQDRKAWYEFKLQVYAGLPVQSAALAWHELSNLIIRLQLPGKEDVPAADEI